MNASNIRVSIPAQKVRAFCIDSDTTENTLNTLGIGYQRDVMKEFIKTYGRYAGLDSMQPSVTASSVVTPLQFLQYFLPESIEIVTAARKIDDIIGRKIVGAWEDEEVVALVEEGIGQARPYGDNTDVPLADFNINFEKRTIVRFEDGFEVTNLEEERASKIRINTGKVKREAAAKSLAIEANAVGFYGYNNGTNRTYGFLNDPNLPAYITVSQGDSGSTNWNAKNFDEITADIRTAVATLTVKLGGNFDSEKDAFVIVLPLGKKQYLSVTSMTGGVSVKDWISTNFPNARIETALELVGANGGADVMYIFAEKIGTGSVVEQNMVEVLRMNGMERRAKGVIESYSNATAGVLWRQPTGVVRYTGI